MITLKTITMKKITLIILNLAVILSCNLALAQGIDKAKADQQAQIILNEYQADLELTIEQVNDFHQKISEYIVKKSEIENKALAPEARKSALKQLSNQETTEMASILTADQIKKYKKLKPKIQPM